MISDTGRGNFGLLKLGIDPETSKPADWQAGGQGAHPAATLTCSAATTGQAYTTSWSPGNLVSMAWSGDIFQQNLSAGCAAASSSSGQGGTLWTDNMMIPRSRRTRSTRCC